LKNLLEKDLSYAVLAEAISSLVKADRENGLKYCARGLSMDSHNDVIRAAAAKALGTVRTSEAKKMLIDLTAYGRPLEVRTAAVESLAKNWKWDEEVRLHIERLVGDRDERVRRKALEELGRIASGRSIPVLLQVLKDEVDTILRNRARESLIKIERAAQR